MRPVIHVCPRPQAAPGRKPGVMFAGVEGCLLNLAFDLNDSTHIVDREQ